jgi:hypothetical protein
MAHTTTPVMVGLLVRIALTVAVYTVAKLRAIWRNHNG